jgi:oxygen-independent coproporphyrinogen-3 oxidase
VYCDFYVELSKYGRQEAFVQALQTEIHQAYQQLVSTHKTVPLQTVYVGGGTPSLLPAKDYQQLFTVLAQYQPFAPTIECTLELNPNSVISPLKEYLAVGFNRLSIGVQSFNPLELKKLTRQHTATEAIETVHQAVEAGFTNISIDLMYGIPTQTLQSWEETLTQALALPITHISLYGLQLETGTALETLVHKAATQYPLPTDDTCLAMYELAIAKLTEAGFYQYEVSNFAKNNAKSHHNLAYWAGDTFWGFGAGATGFVDGIRYENSRNLTEYILNPTLRLQETAVSPLEQLENAFIFGLRLPTGIDTNTLQQQTPTVLWALINPIIATGIEQGQLAYHPTSGYLHITPTWFSRMNDVLALFVNIG